MSDRIAVFNAGKVEQVDVPLAIYNRPMTEFVANFLGDNNVFEGSVTADGRVDVVGLGVITADNAISQLPGTKAKVAVRPESIRPGVEGRANTATIAVQGIVNHGDSVLLFAATGKNTVKVRLPASEAAGFAIGQTVTVSWQPEHVHIIGTRG